MIVEYVRYTIDDAERRADFIKAYETAQKSLQASPHCLGYELAQCTEDETSFVLRIEWDSHEGHLLNFRGSDEFARFLLAVRPFINDIAEMRHYDLTHIHLKKEAGITARTAGEPASIQLVED